MIEKKPEIINTIESNYRIIRIVYQHLYSDIADIFFEYIHLLDPDEIQQLDEDIKRNGWGVINLLQIDNTLELLSTFQLFYHNNGRLLLKNGLLVVPDCEAPEGKEKITPKSFYEMFRYTKSHGLVSMHFLGVFGIFFGAGVKEYRDALTELYKNFSYATLSDGNNLMMLKQLIIITIQI